MKPTSPQNPTGDIAIIGMSCVFPGAPTVQKYWQNILNKVNAIGDPPPEWESDLFLDPTVEANDRVYCARGGYLGALAEFDPTKYGIMPNSVDGTEPDHFLALRSAYEAVADAGYLKRRLDPARTEVIIGRGTYVNRGNTTVVQHALVVDSVIRILKQLHPEHSDEELAIVRGHLKASLPAFHAETAAGLVPNIISGRIANRLDFMGANYLVDAACASSLVALDHGMRDLLSGRCDLALVGGVHASTPPPIVMIFCQLKAISRSGEIRPFDQRADGTLLGEGVGMVALKRREDAERDGDHIYALVKGVGVASDGKALGLLAPRLDGEQLALQRAYESAGVAPETVGLIEAHGTATPVGDVVEIDALNSVFGPRSGDLPTCALGSVKSMISHLMPASGIAGLIKTALALHHRVLPPTINCDEPNPKLGLDTSRFYLNTDTRPWVHGLQTPRRAGVNAFGFGGINAHVVLEEYNGSAPRPASMQHEWDSEAIVLSSDSRPALLSEGTRLLQHLERTPSVNLKDLAFTYNASSPLADVRLSIVATSAADLKTKLARALQRLSDERCQRIKDIEGIYFFATPLGRSGKLALVFPGEGSQYGNMLADLCVHFPEVREVFDFVDRAFADHPRGYLPSQVIFPPPQPGKGDADGRIHRMDSGAEAVFTANQALGRLARELGIKADAMVGHSTGEHSALLVSEAVNPDTDEELIGHIRRVNSVFEQLDARDEIPHGVLIATGGVAISTLRDIVESAPGGAYIAMDNCPHQTVICCTEAAKSAILEQLAARGAISQILPFARAYHTPWFEVFCDPMRDYFAGVKIHRGAADLYSCVTADRYPDDADSVRELVATQWARTVRFRETIEAMYRDGVPIFVEAGPRANLCGFIDDTLRGKQYAAIPMNLQHRSGTAQLNHLVAQLCAHGVPVRMAYLYERRSPQAVDLDKAQATALVPARKPAPLATGLQPIRLPADFKLPRREQPVPAVAAAAPHGNGNGAHPLRPAAAPLPAQAAQVVQRHFEAMDQFLKAQTQVMNAYLAARGNAAAAAAPAHAAPRSLPFCADAQDLVPGERVRVVRRFDLEEDRLFTHHTLGRDVSSTDAGLLALPVVPFTVTMEMLAETAALLHPALLVSGMRQVRASRWITLEQPQILEFVARAASADGSQPTVQVSAHERRADGSLGPSIAEATILFSAAYAACPRAGGFALHGSRRSTWKVDQLYREGMFHGPCFQAVKSIDRYGEDGNVATLEIPRRDDMLRSNTEPQFLIDPVVLDAAGQVLAFWVKERFGTLVDVFPYALDELRCYGPPPPPGTRLDCRVRAELIGDTLTRCDIDIVDTTGAVLYELKGWQDRRFELPAPFVHMRVSPADTYISAAWEGPLGAETSGDVACQRLDCLTESVLDAHGEIWLKVLAHLVLSRRERATWDAMTAVAKRRREWLLGRAVAKDAVRKLVHRQLGLRLAPADVEIAPDALGRPEVHGQWITDRRHAPLVSISHSGGMAVAVATLRPAYLVGIDIESVADRRTGFERAAFTQHERNLVAAVGDTLQLEWYLRMWCAKEAVGKALGRGLPNGPGEIRIRDVGLKSGMVSFDLDPHLLASHPALSGNNVVARTQRDGNIVASAVLCGAN